VLFAQILNAIQDGQAARLRNHVSNHQDSHNKK